jgi:hypothetical protein
MRTRIHNLLENKDKLHDILYVGIVILVAGSAFLLGRLSVVETREQSALITIDPSIQPFIADPVIDHRTSTVGKATAGDTGGTSSEESGLFLASKNGTKYYSKGCSGASRIKPENVVWYATKADAEAAGKSPSSTCKDL